MEPRRAWPQQKEATRAKGKGKVCIIIESPLDKLVSPPSLEGLLFYLSMYEEIPLEVLNERAFSSLGYLFSGEVM